VEDTSRLVPNFPRYKEIMEARSLRFVVEDRQVRIGCRPRSKVNEVKLEPIFDEVPKP
jgi:hypothetical protein